LQRPGFRWRAALIIAIGVLAVATRFYKLTDRSLWLNEIVTAQSAHLASPGDVIAQSEVYVNQAPLFTLFTWLLRSWGDGEFILRLPATIAGILTVFALYLLGKELFGWRAGLVASLLAAVSSDAVWYSQEARNYSLLMLLTTMQMYFAFTTTTRGRRTDWLGLAVCTTLNMYTHYLAFVPTAAITIYVAASLGVDLLRGKPNRVKAAAVAVLVLIAASAAFVPWRSVVRAVYFNATEIMAWAKLQRGAAVATAVISLGLLFLLGRALCTRSRTTKVVATVVLANAAVLMLLMLEIRPFGSNGANFLPPFAIAVGVVAVAFAVAAAPLVLDLLKAPPAVARKLGLALLAGAFVAAAYAPWLPYLRLALSRPEVTTGRIHFNGTPSLGDLLDVLAKLGISGVLLGAFGLGLVALGIWLFRGPARSSILLLTSLAVPIGILWRSGGAAIVGIDIQYWGFLVPTAILVMAAGAEAAVLLLEAAVRRFRTNAWPSLRITSFAASVLVVGALLAQALPILAASYRVPKEDYRSAAERIAAASPPGSVLLAIGNYSDWAVICFQYYLRELHSSVVVVDGMQVTSDTVATLAAGQGVAWGVVIFPSADQRKFLQNATEVRTDFVDATGIIHVVKPVASGLSPEDQARTVLHWEAQLEPRLSASVKLLDVLAGRAQPGTNLVPDPSGQGANGWSFGPGVSTAAGTLDLTPPSSTHMVVAIFTAQLSPLSDYVVGFEYMNLGFSGTQTVDAVPLDAAGNWLYKFPGTVPYQCLHSDSWSRSYIPFSPPPTTVAIALVLSAKGSGTAQFRAIRLSTVWDVR
jgi:hypothetical protein